MIRASRQLEIKNIWLEHDVSVTTSFLQDAQRAITRFARWQGAETVVLQQAPPALLAHWPRLWPLDNS